MSLMKMDDEIRLRILETLLNENIVQPNIRKIQKSTGFHKATIKASLEFLKKKGILKGFGPKIDFKKFGYNIEAVMLWQTEMANKTAMKKFLETTKNDENIYRLSGIIGSSNWNLMSHHIYKDIESYHKDMTKRYYEGLPKIFDVIKDKQIFFETEPFHKIESRTKTLIQLIRKEKGFD